MRKQDKNRAAKEGRRLNFIRVKMDDYGGVSTDKYYEFKNVDFR